MTTLKYYCVTCKRMVTQDDVEYIQRNTPELNPHYDHEIKWFTGPPAMVVPEEVIDVTITDEARVKTDVADVRRIIAHLNTVIFEREELIKALFVCLLCQENMIIYGKPGTGKNYTIELVAKTNSPSFFYTQNYEGTPLDKVFGPFDIMHMREHNEMIRATDGMMLASEIVFLDEIGNSSPPLRNGLKGAMNEKAVRLGKQMV